MDLRIIIWEGVNCMHLAQDRDQWWDHVKTEDGNEASGCIKSWEFLDYFSDYKLLKKDFA
jgi:hypothetical protein